ncbi:MAG: hypothetical protein H6742_17285 [Alphaproteobacteria bacterium]|nr:hypothetical protein [Alphaproteobacteria bacterium]
MPAEPTPPTAPVSRRDRLLLSALALVAVGFAAAMALGPLEGVAHVSDEVAYTLQAKLFAGGMRVGPPADNPSMLLYPFWQTGPVSYAVFPPGWPMLLAAGVAVGLPWAVNALLAGALPPLSFLLATAWGRPGEEARLAAMVAALSPGIVLLSGSRMAHTSVLVALLAALVLVARRRDGAVAWLLGGAGLAYVLLARPFDGVVLGGPLIVAGLLRGRGPARLSWVVLPALAAGWLLLDNQRLTGDALTFPVGPWWDAFVAGTGHPPGCNALGFGDTIGCHPTFGSWGHSPAKASAIAWDALVVLDRHLLGLPGGLLLAAVGAVRLRRPEPLLAFVLVVAGYALYWSPGNVYGARFYHPLYAVLPVLVAVAAGMLPARLRGVLPALVLGVTASVGLARSARELSDHYWCGDGEVARLLDAEGIDEGVVFVQGNGVRETGWPWVGFPSFTCDPLLESGDAMQLMDPTRTAGGLQVRHALPDALQTAAYLDQHAPDSRAWRLEHDITRDRYSLRELKRR